VFVQCILNEFISLEHNNTIQYKYNTDILFPIKEPFRAEQLTKNLIQWLWIDCIDWKMTTFYETRHRLTCVVLSHKYILPSYGTAGSMIPRYLFCLFLCTAFFSGFSIYIFINTTVTFIVWSFCPNVLNFCKYTYFYLFLRNSGHFYFILIPTKSRWISGKLIP
jgi:hypothetical protein